MELLFWVFIIGATSLTAISLWINREPERSSYAPTNEAKTYTAIEVTGSEQDWKILVARLKAQLIYMEP